MRLHYLQQVWFEDAGNIRTWAESHGYDVTRTALFEGEALPSVDDIDILVVMGGPMGIGEEGSYPWMKDEKAFISQAISGGKSVIGICLGAQLIADVLGARVHKNRHREIGWFELKRTDKDFLALPGSFTAFHWHEDTFDLPAGARPIAESEACPNQAFSFDNGRVLGLQFHLEILGEGIDRLVKQCGGELVSGSYIQSADDIAAGKYHLKACNELMVRVLEQEIVRRSVKCKS